mmetsp:Transcript_36024/g.78785  ORF Transcript_36024/g.78785 Transcript_36024/m.78785 type:complete len:164 (-) Transcript_36024:47-538(-)
MPPRGSFDLDGSSSESPQICVGAVAGGAVFFAAAFGGCGAAVQGEHGLLHFLSQATGATLGAIAAVSMHKQDEAFGLLRACSIFGTAVVATALAFAVLPAGMDLGLLVASVITSVGAASVALLTDPDCPVDLQLSAWRPGRARVASRAVWAGSSPPVVSLRQV